PPFRLPGRRFQRNRSADRGRRRHLLLRSRRSQGNELRAQIQGSGRHPLRHCGEGLVRRARRSPGGEAKRAGAFLKGMLLPGWHWAAPAHADAIYWKISLKRDLMSPSLAASAPKSIAINLSEPRLGLSAGGGISVRAA